MQATADWLGLMIGQIATAINPYNNNYTFIPRWIQNKAYLWVYATNLHFLKPAAFNTAAAGLERISSYETCLALEPT